MSPLRMEGKGVLECTAGDGVDKQQSQYPVSLRLQSNYLIFFATYVVIRLNGRDMFTTLLMAFFAIFSSRIPGRIETMDRWGASNHTGGHTAGRLGGG